MKRGTWSQLLHEAGLVPQPDSPDHEQLTKGLRRMSYIDDVEQIRFLIRFLDLGQSTIAPTAEEQRRIEMFHVVLWGSASLGWTVEDADRSFFQNRSIVSDLKALLEYQLARAPAQHAMRVPNLAGPLAIHSKYSRDEILVGLGHWSLARRPDHREGVLHLSNSKVDAFFVTLQKTEDDYSPTTMYEDYLISLDQFHWQSQSNTSAESATGQRYIKHRQIGYNPLLFARETRKLSSGITSPYTFLGPCQYLTHQGSRPMSIVWKLQHAVPARIYRQMARQATG